MNREEQLFGGMIVIVAGLYLAKSFFDNSALNDLFVASALVTSIGIGAKIVQNKKITNAFKKYSQNKGGGPNYSTDECKEIAKDWAKKNFHGRINSKKGISFDWTQSSTQPGQVYDQRQDEWIDVRYFYSPHGPKNKAVLIFVDATNGKHYATESVIPHKMKDNPFNYLESYKQTKRFASHIARANNQEETRVGTVTGIPVNQNFVPQPDQEGED